MIKSSFNILLTLLLLMLVAGRAASGQTFNQHGYAPSSKLTVAHADFDPTSGDLLIISNSWRDTTGTLRRFHPNGESVREFRLERYEACCAIEPSLVTVSDDGSIFTLEYSGSLGGFYIYKHDPSGELDVDWGQREETVLPSELSSLSDTLDSDGGEDSTRDETYDKGDTSLDWNRGGGRLHFFFSSPVDMRVRSDGSLLVLDQAYAYVYLVSPDGTEVSEFIGNNDYYPIRPQRMVIDSQENIYIVDTYDEFGFDRAFEYGVFKFSPDGRWESGWGEVADGINDPWRTGLDLMTLVVDGEDNLIVLGNTFNDRSHSDVFVFNADTGDKVLEANVQFRNGFDYEYLGILPRLGSGFMILDEFGFEIQASYYTIDGVREEKIEITDLYENL